MKVYMNTFCLMQNIDSARDRNQTYLGKRTFKEKTDADVLQTKENKKTAPSTPTRYVYWELQKKHIDLAHKNEEINPNFSVFALCYSFFCYKFLIQFLLTSFPSYLFFKITFAFEIGKTSPTDFMQRKDQRRCELLKFRTTNNKNGEDKVVFRLDTGAGCTEDSMNSSEKLNNNYLSVSRESGLRKNESSFFRDLIRSDASRTKMTPKRSTSEPAMKHDTIASISPNSSEVRMPDLVNAPANRNATTLRLLDSDSSNQNIDRANDHGATVLGIVVDNKCAPNSFTEPKQPPLFVGKNGGVNASTEESSVTSTFLMAPRSPSMYKKNNPNEAGSTSSTSKSKYKTRIRKFFS